MTRQLNYSSLFSYPHDNHFKGKYILRYLHCYLNHRVILYYNKMARPNIGRHQEERHQLARKRNGKIVGRKTGLETFHPLSHTEWK
jgi:hypothetical protein